VADDIEPLLDEVANALSAFVDAHRACGDLSTDMTDLPGGEAQVWMLCDGCGVRLERTGCWTRH